MKDEKGRPLFKQRCINCGATESYTAGKAAARVPICQKCRKQIDKLLDKKYVEVEDVKY